MKDLLNKIRTEAIAQLADENADIEALRVRYLGKKGELTKVLRGMGALSAEERPVVGALANTVRANIEAALKEAVAAEEARKLDEKLKKEKLDVKIYNLCLAITALRKEKGAQFCERVTNELKTLNINSAKFEISFKDYTSSDVNKANSNGLDEICFMFSANAGEPMKPLGKIISGGEMSRFMLAIKTQLSSVNEISTYIFDEIDAGISGKTARVVGEKFAQIAKNTQIIAVSHLAQIASMSDKEFLIEKYEDSNKTHTKVLELDEKLKTDEIIRLLGGNLGDEFAQKHAEELLKQAKEYKNSL